MRCSRTSPARREITPVRRAPIKFRQPHTDYMARATDLDLVRVHGLTSDAGKRLNGCVGAVVTDSGGERVGVVISGEMGPRSIKWSNLELYPDVVSDSSPNTFSNGVGRASMCSLSFTARSMRCTGPPELVSVRFEGDCCARSRGNLAVVTRLMRDGKLPAGTACVMLTDLNVVRAVNLAAVGAPVALASTNEPELKMLVEALKRRSGTIVAEFSPHRCVPDRAPGRGRRYGRDPCRRCEGWRLSLLPSIGQKGLDRSSLLVPRGGHWLPGAIPRLRPQRGARVCAQCSRAWRLGTPDAACVGKGRPTSLLGGSASVRCLLRDA